ncbi:MAG: FG-GAP-like repeat-containing protein [Acidobacteriota bacterium]|nr:FG-GAP-like repeat-containing protein [Acidobacteriota bacterium]
MKVSRRSIIFAFVVSLSAALTIELARTAAVTSARLDSRVDTIVNPLVNPPVNQSPAEQSSEQTKREEAYRANNIGVGLLEQYKAREAAESFNRALEIDPHLELARINRSIALYYIPEPESAKREAESGLAQDPNTPQLHYVLGLIARSQDRLDDAIAEFQQVLKTDPADPGAQINLGQLFVQQRKFNEAITAFRTAIEAEPYNLTALYNLGLLLTRTGAKEEGRHLVEKFRQLQQSGAGTNLGTKYLEGGRYAEAVASKGAERDLVDRVTPNVKFTDATDDFFGSAPENTKNRTSTRSKARMQNSAARADAVVLFDYDGDGDLDLFDASGSQRLLRNDGGKFTDVTEGSGLSITGSKYCFAAVAGDYDNDGKPDLLAVRSADSSFILYHNDGNGHFSDRTKQAGIKIPSAQGAPYLSAAFVDVDHDGDLDIFITGPTNILLRNNGDSTFTEITQTAKVSSRDSFSTSSAIVPTDFDNRRDVDLFLLSHDEPPTLFRNMRNGTFLNVAKEVGLDSQGIFSCAAAGDVNKDGFTDFFLGSEGQGMFFMSDGRGHFRSSPAPAETKGAMAAQFLDYDNDGLLDLLAITTTGLHIWRNVGEGFVDVSDRALPAAFKSPAARRGFRGKSSTQTAMASADLDGDGYVDLILRAPDGKLRLLRNDGGNGNYSLRARLRGRVSNTSAIEAKIEVRAGSLWQKLETYSAWPAPAPADIVFGLGKRKNPDAVRILWPSGIVQAETEFPKLTYGEAKSVLSLSLTELDRKPSSCPYLYTWNGERFEFVTDFMGGGEMGYLEQPGRYNKPDPNEYVRITDDKLKERNGRFEIRVTDELEEAMFLDQIQLIAVAHPEEVEIYPNEGMTDPPRPFKIYASQGAHPPLAATDDHGQNVLDLISRVDRRYPDNFRRDRIRGYAEEHALTLKLDERAKSRVYDNRVKSSRTLLLLTGWTDYAWSSDNVAASQAGKKMKPPALQVKDPKGNWRTVIEDIGIPVGRPQTVTVDLTGKFLTANREVRILTNMRIYWDQILVDTTPGNLPMGLTRLDPVRADLSWRGFSRETTPDGREPFSYDYQSISFTSPWKVMTGRYTREGDVRELLLKSDDMFVISGPGDEISLSFDATALTPLEPGWKRTFLLFADGFSKEMDVNSASPDQIMPLPFHGMTRYPYAWPERYPMTAERRAYVEKYNTRVVLSPVPSIDAAIVQR